MSEAYCPVCNSAGAQIQQAGDGADVVCRRCGGYHISGTLRAILTSQPRFVELRPYLSAHLRQSSERKTPALINENNWEEFALRHRDTPVSQKLERVLQVLGQRSRPGHPVGLDNDDFVLFDAADSPEMAYLADDLVAQELLRQPEEFQGGYLITPRGWERLTSAVPGGIPGTCFVAMAFGKEFDPIYDHAIEPAINACGLRPIRVDRIPYNGIVNDVMLAELRRAQVVVADVTGQRAGVYFEAGFAIGLGRDVIWCCRDDEMEKVHFDTRQYGHVVWKDAADLRQKLEARIRGTVSIPVTN